MINPLNYILLFFVSIMISGCVQGVKTEVIQKEEFSYLKFTGDTELISVIIDDGTYNFNLTKNNKESLYKIDTGKHRIKIYKNQNLIVDRVIFLENHVTTEINIR